MSHRLITTIALTISLLTAAFAQDDFHQINVDKNIPKPIQNRKFYIDKVVDARADTISAGIVQKGMFNKKTNAKLALPATQYFGQLLEKNQCFYNISSPDTQINETASLPGAEIKENIFTVQSGMIPLIAVLKELQVSEWTGAMSEKGQLEMTFEFFREDTSKNLVSIFETEIFVETGGMDVTGTHPYRISTGFMKSLSILNNFLSKNSTERPFYSDFDEQFGKYAEKNDLKLNEWPVEKGPQDNIFTTTQLRPGLYRNFEDFKNNRPIVTGNLRAEYFDKDQKAHLTIKSKNNKILKGRFFGFCDGKDIYIYSGNYKPNKYFCKVEEKGALYIWKDNVYDSGDMIAQSAFGLVGLLVNSAVKGTDCLFLDTRNGLINQANAKTLKKLLADKPELLKEFENETSPNISKNLFSTLIKYNKLIN